MGSGVVTGVAPETMEPSRDQLGAPPDGYEWVWHHGKHGYWMLWTEERAARRETRSLRFGRYSEEVSTVLWIMLTCAIVAALLAGFAAVILAT